MNEEEDNNIINCCSSTSENIEFCDRSFRQPIAHFRFLEAAKLFRWTVIRIDSQDFEELRWYRQISSLSPLRSEVENALFKAFLIQFAHCIEEVSASGVDYTVDTLQAIGGCQELRYFMVYCKNMDDNVLVALSNCRELEQVRFEYSQPSEHQMSLKGLSYFYEHVQKLTEILLDGAFIDGTVVSSDIQNFLIAASGQCLHETGFAPEKQLELLTINNDQGRTDEAMCTVDDNVLHCLARAFHSIKDLRLEHAEGVSDAGFIDMIQHLVINSLFLNNFTGITASSLHAIVEHCSGLCEIEIEYCSQLVIDEPLLRAMLTMRSLKRISFHGRVDQGLLPILNFTPEDTTWKIRFDCGDELEYPDNFQNAWVIVVIER